MSFTLGMEGINPPSADGTKGLYARWKAETDVGKKYALGTQYLEAETPRSNPMAWRGPVYLAATGETHYNGMDELQNVANHHNNTMMQAASSLASDDPRAKQMIDTYNRGGALNSLWKDAFGRYDMYFEQGQAKPGKFTSQTAKNAQIQWGKDAAPSGFSSFMDVAIPVAMGAMVGAGALGYGAGGAASTAGTGAATTAGTTAATGTGYQSLTNAAINSGLSGGSSTLAGNAALSGAGASTGLGTAAGGATLSDAAVMGLGTGSTMSTGAANGSSLSDYFSNLGGDNLTTGNGLQSLISGGLGLYSANQTAGAADDASAEARRQFDISQQNMQPWLDAGKSALTEQQKLMGLNGDPQESLASLVASPGYTFRKQQGNQNQAALTAARGGMGSGKAATAASRWNQDYASGEYGNRLNQLATLSGTGQTTSNNLATLGQQVASDTGNAGMTAANARASGLQAAGGALSSYLWPNQTPTLRQVNGQWVYQ